MTGHFYYLFVDFPSKKPALYDIDNFTSTILVADYQSPYSEQKSNSKNVLKSSYVWPLSFPTSETPLGGGTIVIKYYGEVVIIIVTFIVADYWCILDIRLC